MFIDDDTTPTIPDGFPEINISSNKKLRIEIKTIVLFFTVECEIHLLMGNRLLSKSKKFDRPPTNIQINAFVRKKIIENKALYKKFGVDVYQELRNFA